ncbi:MAG: beta-ketoacyl synthase chain length factor [Chitinophagales bacterium]|nr:beta-ketoacyl synthase chain length factor [Chitinophagaceae bacterium]MCB9065037.1 beta-ketoacyl synthase chain length factor [Chitinophagales bacterium]
MMHPIYISATSIISPQQNFEYEDFLQDIKSSDDGTLFIIDPNYRDYINPVAIRRMSKMLKMGISTGMNCLQQAGITTPDAIITGTGRGSMVDMEQFLMDMIKLEEEALTPTAFIQSTYNSVNGWLALNTKCKGYNQTYVHRGTSFELALLDAQLLLNESNSYKNILVGCYDEITPDYIKVKSKIGYWKNPVPDSTLDLFKHNDTNGTIAGEGAAFFTITNNKEQTLCSINTIKMLQDANIDDVNNSINEALTANGMTLADVDVLLCGMNGDARQQPMYNAIIENTESNTSIAAFKHLCGEYDTSSGFATWIASNIFKHQSIPEILLQKKGEHSSVKNILLVNSYILNSTSIILYRSIS